MKGYDFEVLVDELNDNKKKAIERDKQEQIKSNKKVKKYRLKKWIIVVLFTLFVAFMLIAIYQIKTIKTTYSTPVGSYTCYGKLIQVCSGSKEVANYLGV